MKQAIMCAGSSSMHSCLLPAQKLVGQHLQSFREFPPRQRPGSFSVEQAMEMLRCPPSSN